MEWIDALRGLTMILVVANHVGMHSFGQKFGASASMPFLVLMRMPMFFFISGFLAYKSGIEWNFGTYCRLTAKKLRVQVIPTLVFFFAFVAVAFPSNYCDTVLRFFHSPMKGGYWFTIALLYMFVVYYAIEFLLNKIRWKGLAPYVIVWVIGVLLYESCFLPKQFDWAVGHKGGYEGWLNDTSFVEFMKYFHFFIFGNIVHRYWNRVQQLFDNKWVILAIIGITFFSSIEFLKIHWLHGQWANLTRTFAQYGLFTLVFMAFRYYKDNFTKEHRAGRCLQYVGTRTLDVYLLHYFFLPNLPMVGEFFNTYKHNFAIDTTFQLLVAAVVIAFCLLVSNILRISPTLKLYLFGRKG